MVNEEDVEKALSWLAENAANAAKAHAERYQLEKGRERIKSKLMQNYEGSAAAQERDALASDEYEAYLEGVAAAIEKDELFKWRKDLAYAKKDVWQSHSANTRQVR